jgi:hypothetical protein
MPGTELPPTALSAYSESVAAAVGRRGLLLLAPSSGSGAEAWLGLLTPLLPPRCPRSEPTRSSMSLRDAGVVACARVSVYLLHRSAGRRTSETRPLPAARPAAMRELRSSRARLSSASLARLASISARRRVSDADMAAGCGRQALLHCGWTRERGEGRAASGA